MKRSAATNCDNGVKRTCKEVKNFFEGFDDLILRNIFGNLERLDGLRLVKNDISSHTCTDFIKRTLRRVCKEWSRDNSVVQLSADPRTKLLRLCVEGKGAEAMSHYRLHLEHRRMGNINLDRCVEHVDWYPKKDLTYDRREDDRHQVTLSIDALWNLHRSRKNCMRNIKNKKEKKHNKRIKANLETLTIAVVSMISVVATHSCLYYVKHLKLLKGFKKTDSFHLDGLPVEKYMERVVANNQSTLSTIVWN